MHSNVVVEFLALNTPALPEEQTFKTALEVFGFKRSQIEDYKTDESMISFLYRGGVCVLKLVEAPLTWKELEKKYETVAAGQDNGSVLVEKMQHHSSHIIVTWFSRSSTAIDRYLMLTRAMAALASVTDTAGIYWGAGSLLHARETFINESRNIQDDAFPLQLWVDFKLMRTEDGRYLLSTTGLEALGCAEIRILEPQNSADETYNIAFQLAQSLLAFGSSSSN
jgi:hypothetical protein